MLLLVVSFQGMAQNTENPVEYMNFFSEEFKALQSKMWDYTSKVSHGKSARKIENTRKELIAQSNQAVSKVRTAKPYKGDKTYKDSVLHYFTVVNLVLKEDYEKLVNMEEVAEQSYDLMEAYMTARELAGQKQNEASQTVNRAQKAFCAANNINLLEASDNLSKKMEVAGKVYEHYNEVYLIFFKSMKQEAYLIDAISRQDVSSIEQNREALAATAEEGLNKLKAVKLHENDPSMVQATEALLKMYQTESKDVEAQLNYLLMVEKFNTVKAAFDQKKEKDRKQEDVDQYNKAVNDMNNSVNASNTVNEKYNKSRSKMIDNWNNTAEKFTNKHVPK